MLPAMVPFEFDVLLCTVPATVPSDATVIVDVPFCPSEAEVQVPAQDPANVDGVTATAPPPPPPQPTMNTGTNNRKHKERFMPEIILCTF